VVVFSHPCFPQTRRVEGPGHVVSYSWERRTSSLTRSSIDPGAISRQTSSGPPSALGLPEGVREGMPHGGTLRRAEDHSGPVSPRSFTSRTGEQQDETILGGLQVGEVRRDPASPGDW